MKKPKSPLWYLLPFGVIFVVLGVVLAFIHPLAPLLLVGSLAIQLPIIIGITKTNLTAGYRDRAWARLQRYAEDDDAEALLAEEEKEAASVGFKYWSRGARALSRLNRAAALAALGRRDEAAGQLAEIGPKDLSAAERDRFDAVVDSIREGAPGPITEEISQPDKEPD